jgi:hypothetical protein
MLATAPARPNSKVLLPYPPQLFVASRGRK